MIASPWGWCASVNREWRRLLEVGARAHQPLACRREGLVVVAVGDLHGRFGQLVGHVPLVAEVEAAGRAQPRARQRVAASALEDRGRQAIGVDVTFYADLELHAPGLGVTVEMQIELVEDIERD